MAKKKNRKKHRSESFTIVLRLHVEVADKQEPLEEYNLEEMVMNWVDEHCLELEDIIQSETGSKHATVWMEDVFKRLGK